jgi:hypothetical protein
MVEEAKVRRVHGAGWYADVPSDVDAGWVATLAATLEADDDQPLPAGPAVVLRGRVLHASDEGVVASCGGLLAGVRAPPPSPLGGAVRVVLRAGPK